jgi:hypothetical protein
MIYRHTAHGRLEPWELWVVLATMTPSVCPHHVTSGLPDDKVSPRL